MKPEEKSVLQKNTRRSDIEMYRIVCMLLIVMHHYVVNSGLMDAGGPIQTNGTAKRTLFLLVLGAWGKTAINGFIMITGYFMCKKNITLIKFLKLLFETMFYRIVINLIFCISGYTAFTAETLKSILFPVRDVSFSFPQVYLVFFLCIPFMNILLRRLTEEKHVALLLLVGFTYTFLGSFPGTFSVRMNYLSWFCAVYLLGAFFGMYPKRIFANRRFWAIIMAGTFGISAATVLFAAKNGTDYYTLVSDSNKLLPVLNGVSSFMFFKNLNIPYNRLINKVAASAYGVLLIHSANATMRKWLWKDTLKVVGAFTLPWPQFLTHVVLSVTGIFVICIVIDMLRIRFLERPVLRLAEKCMPSLRKRWMCLNEWAYQKIEAQKPAS